MVSDELKPKKRIRHKFNKSELYHRFVNSEEYAYCAGRKLTCKYDYISICDIGENSSRRNIQDNWCLNKNRIIAIIDRLNKEIIISRQYPEHSNNIRYALPNNYTIWYCDGPIPKYNILSILEREALYKLHLKHIAGVYFNSVYGSFFAVKHGKKVLHYDIDNLSDGYNIYSLTNIKNIVKKYNINKYDWYVKPLDEKFNIDIYYSNNLSWRTTILPSLKTLISKKVFSNKDKDIFRKRYFYTKYCFGRGIPFSDVDKYFGKSITHDEAVRYCNRRNIYLNTDWLVDVHTWNELISKTYEIERKIHKNYIAEQVAKSETNYNAALEELRQLESNYTVNSWREGKVNIGQYSVSYRKYSAPSRYNSSGTWMTAAVHSSCRTFTNTQLKLEGSIIRTSKNATVTLEEGIKMYKMFMIGRNNNPNRTSWTTSDFGNVKVGIYNLRFITYKDKISDSGKSLGYKEWCIQIGCHSLWLDDIIDFIHYYHLENKFNLNEETLKILNYE